MIRDPIGEFAGLNPYSFVRNSPIGKVDLLGLAELSTGEYRRFLQQTLDSGIRDIDEVWRRVLGHYLENDPETDCFWDCEDDLENIIEAFFDVLDDDDSQYRHGARIAVGIHSGDGSALTHFFAGAAWEGALEIGDTAQNVWEIVSPLIDGGSDGDGDYSRGNDWALDTAYAYAGADFSDYFDTWSESECRKRVREFTSSVKSITSILGPSVPDNTDAGINRYRAQFRVRLGLR